MKKITKSVYYVVGPLPAILLSETFFLRLRRRR